MSNEKRILREIKTLLDNKEPGFSIYYDTECILDVKPAIYIKTTINSGLYQGQTHLLKFDVTYAKGKETFSYPYQAPRVKFISHILHANIGQSGSICLDTLNSKWIPTMSLLSVYQTILVLLDNPEYSSPLNSNGIFKDEQEAKIRVSEYYTKNLTDPSVTDVINAPYFN